MDVAAQGQAGWTTLFDGTSLKGWNRVGDANWEIVDGAVQANKGMTSFLVTPMSYGDFQMTAEIWVTDEANSGIFIRCQDPKTITAMNAYEVNVYDKRPDPAYRTGAIVDVAKPMVNIKPAAGGTPSTSRRRAANCRHHERDENRRRRAQGPHARADRAAVRVGDGTIQERQNPHAVSHGRSGPAEAGLHVESPPSGGLAGMKRHLLSVVLVIGVAAAAAAQFNRGVPFGTRMATEKDFDGRFNFCRLVYQGNRNGGSWTTDYPNADINMSIRLAELTKTRVSFYPNGQPNHLLVRPTDARCSSVRW